MIRILILFHLIQYFLYIIAPKLIIFLQIRESSIDNGPLHVGSFIKYNSTGDLIFAFILSLFTHDNLLLYLKICRVGDICHLGNDPQLYLLSKYHHRYVECLSRNQTWLIEAQDLKGTPVTLMIAVSSRTSPFVSVFCFQGVGMTSLPFLNQRCFFLLQTFASSAKKNRQNCSTEHGNTISNIFCFSVSTFSGLNKLISIFASSKFLSEALSFCSGSQSFALSTSELNFSFFHSALIILYALSFLKPLNINSSSCWFLLSFPSILMISIEGWVIFVMLSIKMAAFFTMPNILETNIRCYSPMQSRPKNEKFVLRVHLQSWKMVWYDRPRFQQIIYVVVFFFDFTGFTPIIIRNYNSNNC